jgi:glycosyltransferase involved in cell wall biosynthesis
VNQQLNAPRLVGLKLGILVSQYPARSHTFVRREIAALRAHGADVKVFAIRRLPESEVMDELDREAFDTTTAILPASAGSLLGSHAAAWLRNPLTCAKTVKQALSHRLPGTRSLVWSAFYMVEATILAGHLKREGIHHLHVHFANAGANIARLAARLAGITWSMTLHGACDFEYPHGPTLAPKLREAAFTVCISRYGMSQAMREVDPAYWDRITLSRCGIEPSEMPEARGPAETRATINVVCVGRLSPEKGHLGLLEGFAEAKRRMPALRLTLVGDGPLRPRVEARIRELGLEGCVELAGSVSEPEALQHIARGDVFVLSSFMEGVPVVLMEAMTLRVPVIAPRVAGIPELVEHDVSGLLFHPADWTDLSVKLERLAGDPALRDRLAQAAERKVAEEFSMPHAVDGFVKRLATVAHCVATTLCHFVVQAFDSGALAVL